MEQEKFSLASDSRFVANASRVNCCSVEITCCSSLLCCCCSVSLLWMMTLLQGGRGGFTVEGGQTGGKRHADPASFSFSLHPLFFISSPNCSSFFSNNIFRFSVQIVTLSLPMLSFSILYISPAPSTPPSSNASSINSFIISRLQSLRRRDGFLENWRHFEPHYKAHFQPLLLCCNLMVTQENAQTHNALQSYGQTQN